MNATIDRQTSSLSPAFLALYKAGIRLSQASIIYRDATDNYVPCNVVNWQLNQLRVAVDALPATDRAASYVDRAREGILRAEAWWDRWVSWEGHSDLPSVPVELRTVSDLLLAWARSLGPDGPAAAAWFELGTLIIEVYYDDGQPAGRRAGPTTPGWVWRQRARIDQLLTQTGHMLAELFPDDPDGFEALPLPDFLAGLPDYATWGIVALGLESLAAPADSDDPPESRLLIEADARAVILDGVEHVIENPKAFLIFQKIADSRPTFVPSRELQAIPGCKKCRVDRKIKDCLPPALQDIIYRQGGKGGGYSLRLARKRP